MEVLINAIETFGKESQVNVAIEEMSELIKELCKEKRCQTSKFKIAEEIADVEIMLEQLKMIYAANELVKVYKSKKLSRLEDRIASKRKYIQKCIAQEGEE